jgi:cytochrome c553
MRWILNAFGLLVAGSLPLVCGPAVAEFGRQEFDSQAASSISIVRLAQAQSVLSVDPNVTVKPGEPAKLPARFTAATGASVFNLVVRQLPEWLSLSDAEFVGSGVWLVRAARLQQVNLVAKPNAPAGPLTLAVSLVASSGEIVSESKLQVTVAGSAGAPPTKASTASTAEAPQRIAQAGKTWEQLVGPGQVAPPGKQAQPPRAAPVGPSAGTKSEAELLSHARFLVRECTTCHSLYGQDIGIPPMIGLSRDRFLETMDLYRTSKRDNQAMIDIAKSLTEDETQALAIYLGRIRPPAPEEAAALARSSRVALPAPQLNPARRADPGAQERVTRWVGRGKQLLDTGDIAQARLFFQRAADYGNAQAAVLMANSYDPNTLPWRPGMGLEAEPLRARQWYQLAVSLGAGSEAERRLADLPQPR